MAEVIPGWDKAVSKAQKVLGDNAKIPVMKGPVQKALDGEDKAFSAFDKGRDDLEDQVLALIDATNAIIDALEQFRDAVGESDFGLKDKGDAKKVAEARKMLLAPIDAGIANIKTNAKNERELNKHLANIRTYKQGR